MSRLVDIFNENLLDNVLMLIINFPNGYSTWKCRHFVFK